MEVAEDRRDVGPRPIVDVAEVGVEEVFVGDQSARVVIASVEPAEKPMSASRSVPNFSGA